MSHFSYQGLYPGAVGEVVRAHGIWYAKHMGLNMEFESLVAMELGGIVKNFDPKRDFFTAAQAGGRFAGSISVDGGRPEDPARTKNEAYIRFFIVTEEFQGSGLGRELFTRSMAFVRDAGFDSVYLYTFDALTQARGMYERAGFTLTHDETIEACGKSLCRLRYDLKL
jgi:ribosomal protein S18 acetylase RimI-like enzyme